MDALWIGPGAWQQDALPVSPHPILFRRQVQLPSQPSAASLQITAHQKYILYVNGKRIEAGPARCYPERQLVDTLDLAPHLRAGENAIAVYVLTPTGATGYSVTARPGLYCRLEATCDAQNVTLVSDSAWRARSAEWISSEGFFTSLATGTQEHMSVAHVPADALSGSLDSVQPVRVMGAAGTPPYLTLEPRPIPLLTETFITPKLVYSGHGEAVRWPISSNLARRFSSATIDGRSVEPAEAADLTLDTQGTNVVTLDFGKTRLLRPGFDVVKAEGECRIELYYDLTLKERPSAMLGFGSAREGFSDSVDMPRAGLEFATLQPRGCRFITLRLSGSGRCQLALRCHAIDYPFADPRPSPSQDALIVRIWQTSCETLRSAANDVYVDTCARENVLWTIDACLSGKAGFDSFGETRLWRRCLSLIAQGISSTGIPHSVVPSQDSFMILFDQAMYFVVSCRDYVARTGDRTLINDVWPAIHRFLSLCQKHMTTEDLFVPPAYSWHFIDWAPIPKRAYSLPINAMLALALDAAATLRAGESKSFVQSSGLIKGRLKQFWDPAAGCYGNHVEPAIDIGPQSTFNAPAEGSTLTHGLHANALALHCGLGSPAQRESVAKWMAAQMALPLGPQNRFGPGWTEIILDPLFEYGFGSQALEFIKRVYGQALDAGAPTWAEGFNSVAHNTAHGWGAIVNSLLAKRCKESGASQQDVVRS